MQSSTAICPRSAPTVRPMKLSAASIARNEARRIGRCRQSLQGGCDEIVVVLNDATDETESVCRAHGARVFQRDWSGFRDQKNHAASLCGGEWILSIDAVQAVSAGLRPQIEAFIGSPGRVVGLQCPRKTWFMGRWIEQGLWYPDLSLRVYRRGRGEWVGEQHHERLAVDGPVSRDPGLAAVVALQLRGHQPADAEAGAVHRHVCRCPGARGTFGGAVEGPDSRPVGFLPPLFPEAGLPRRFSWSVHRRTAFLVATLRALDAADVRLYLASPRSSAEWIARQGIRVEWIDHDPWQRRQPLRDIARAMQQFDIGHVYHANLDDCLS